MQNEFKKKKKKEELEKVVVVLTENGKGMKGKKRRNRFNKVPSTVSSLFPAKALIRSETKTTTVSSVVG